MPVEPHDRGALRRVANPLHVGSAGETHFLFGDDRFAFWGTEFARAAGRDGLDAHDPVDVARLRRWIRDIRPELGLRDEVADLVILAWAALRQRAWYQSGGAIPVPKPGALREQLELRPQPMPAPADWEAAVTRTQELFGLFPNRYLTPPAVADLTEQVQRAAARLADPAAVLAERLRTAYELLGLDTSAEAGRLATATAAAELMTKLQRAGDRVRVVQALAQSPLPATGPAVAKSLSTAAEVAGAVHSFRWTRLRPLTEAESREDEPGRQAARIMRDLRKAVLADEFATPLPRALATADDAVFEWLAGQPDQPPSPPGAAQPAAPAAPNAGAVPVVGLPRQTTPGSARRQPGEPAGSVLDAVRDFLDAHPDHTVVVEWRIER